MERLEPRICPLRLALTSAFAGQHTVLAGWIKRPLLYHWANAPRRQRCHAIGRSVPSFPATMLPAVLIRDWPWAGPGLAAASCPPVASRPVHSAFYEPAGPGTFFATPATAGPWSAQAQHGGPPSALVAHEFEHHKSDGGQRLARVAVDILRPVPLGKVSVSTRMVRPGRRVALLEAVMEAGGHEVLHARGWRIAFPGGPVPAVPQPGAPPPIPAEQPQPTFSHAHAVGYLSAIEWRFLNGGFDEYVPSRTWTRPRIPLLAGEEASPMCRAMRRA